MAPKVMPEDPHRRTRLQIDGEFPDQYLRSDSGYWLNRGDISGCETEMSPPGIWCVPPMWQRKSSPALIATWCPYRDACFACVNANLLWFPLPSGRCWSSSQALTATVTGGALSRRTSSGARTIGYRPAFEGFRCRPRTPTRFTPSAAVGGGCRSRRKRRDGRPAPSKPRGTLRRKPKCSSWNPMLNAMNRRHWELV